MGWLTSVFVDASCRMMWPPPQPQATLPTLKTRYRVRAACTRLGLPRLPLVQLHWDDFGAPGYLEVARHLADLQRRGLLAAWGVCNWDVPRLLELVEAGLTPATNQVGGGRLVRALSALCCALEKERLNTPPPPFQNPTRSATASSTAAPASSSPQCARSTA
jgi:aryl-alcohol dehydrogenase-like predicted oxidoreductase